MAPRITVQEVDVKAEQRKRRLKVGAISIGAAVVLIGGSGMAWYLTPPALPKTIEEARTLVESPRFERLSKAQKQPYLDVIREQYGSLDRDARRAMMQENEQMREALWASRDAQEEAYTKAYVLATPEERLAMDAERDAERAARRNEGGGGDRPRGGPPNGGGGPNNERVNERMTNGNSQNSQLRSEMRAERHKKQKAQQQSKGS